MLTLSHQPEEKKKKKERERDFELEPDVDEFNPTIKMEMDQQGDRPVRACRTQQGKNGCPLEQHRLLFSEWLSVVSVYRVLFWCL